MPEPALFAIVLAAGRASRFGSAKQLARYRGQALVARALREAEAVCGSRSLLVTGHQGAAVYAAAAPISGFRVHNSEFATGLASSIAAAVAVLDTRADGVLLMLADQPLVDRVQLGALARAWRQNPQGIVASAYAGKSGVPAIFPQRLFGQLRELRGDRGARSLLRQAAGDITCVPCEAAAMDIDRPADLDEPG